MIEKALEIYHRTKDIIDRVDLALGRKVLYENSSGAANTEDPIEHNLNIAETVKYAAEIGFKINYDL